MVPEQQVLTFIHEIPAGSGAATLFCDTARALSVVNRRLTRQMGLFGYTGCQVFVRDKDTGDGVQYVFTVETAPNNWVTIQSLKKAFALWRSQQKQAYDSVGDISPKWADFKVYLSEHHKQGDELTPTSGSLFTGSDQYNVGTWQKSRIVSVEESGADAGEFQTSDKFLHILGDNSGAGTPSWGIIKAYQNSRAEVQSPDPHLPTSGIENNMYAVSSDPLSVQTEEILENIELVGNRHAPYDPDDYPGSNSNGQFPIMVGFGANANTKNPVVRTNGFVAPNGLVQFYVNLDGHDNEHPHEVMIQLFCAGKEEY